VTLGQGNVSGKISYWIKRGGTKPERTYNYCTMASGPAGEWGYYPATVASGRREQKQGVEGQSATPTVPACDGSGRGTRNLIGGLARKRVLWVVRGSETKRLDIRTPKGRVLTRQEGDRATGKRKRREQGKGREKFARKGELVRELVKGKETARKQKRHSTCF